MPSGRLNFLQAFTSDGALRNVARDIKEKSIQTTRVDIAVAKINHAQKSITHKMFLEACQINFENGRLSTGKVAELLSQFEQGLCPRICLQKMHAPPQSTC